MQDSIKTATTSYSGKQTSSAGHGASPAAGRIAHYVAGVSPIHARAALPLSAPTAHASWRPAL